MSEKTSLKTSIISTIVAALCCFTPVLVIGLGAAGLSAWVGGIDYVVFPIMFVSMGFAANSLYVRAGRTGPKPMALIGLAVAVFTFGLLWLEFRYALRITLAAAGMVGVYAWYLRSAAPRNSGSPRDTNEVENQS